MQGGAEPAERQTAGTQTRPQKSVTGYGVWIDGFPEVRLTNFILKA